MPIIDGSDVLGKEFTPPLSFKGSSRKIDLELDWYNELHSDYLEHTQHQRMGGPSTNRARGVGPTGQPAHIRFEPLTRLPRQNVKALRCRQTDSLVNACAGSR
jgi:hypothetical protein